MNVKRLLSARIEAALKDCGVEAPALVKTASRPEYGHYQADGVMAAAKKVKANPRQLAAEVINRLNADDMAQTVEVAGPGFLNIRLGDQFLASKLDLEAPLIDKADRSQTVVVDYSCPNLAKEMHVGHLRSTIIGDAVARILEALGHQVIRQNHVGDWGTQFGMLLAHFDDGGTDSETLSDLEAYYRAAKVRFDAEPDFQAASRAMVVALQAGEAGARARWRRFIQISLDHCQTLYERLGASLGPHDVMAESAYNDALPGVIEALDAQGLLTESDGARCVFLPEFRRKDGSITPLIAQKSDGAYLYATTDLAAIRHRAQALGADRALYFTDSRQAFHFKQVFAVAQRAGFAGAALKLEHMPFGAMLGKDGKPFKTREGGVIKLTALLDEAEARAARLVREKNPQLDADEQAQVARAVGIGAVKYADLSKNRTSDYLFDWEQMLAFEGNTAPYLLYAYARIQSLFRRGDIDPETLGGKARPGADAERDLAFVLARLQEVVEQVAEDGYPHSLCAYLYDLATKFTRFYEQCPILTAEGAERANRLRFAQQTARTLHAGLGLLGINTVPRM
ncbi:MAG: arginine--tRNA ligase [Gammaproteobacteria bacterium]|nr:arginine--tRNA ligase [Gammaproteobacteria bacterium]